MGGLDKAVIDGFKIAIELVGKANFPFYFKDVVLGCESEIAIDNDDSSTIEGKGHTKIGADGGFAFSY